MPIAWLKGDLSKKAIDIESMYLIIKNIIRLFVPFKRQSAFKQLFDAIESKKDFPLEVIQNIVTRLKEIFPDEIKQLDRLKFKEWIEQNEVKWKERIEPIHLDKLSYVLAKKAE